MAYNIGRIDFGRATRLILRYTIVGVIAGFLLPYLMKVASFIGGIQYIGLLLLGVAVLAMYLFALNIHPGIENFLIDVVPYIVVAEVVSKWATSVGANIPMLTMLAMGALFSTGVSFAVALATIFIIDSFIVKWFDLR